MAVDSLNQEIRRCQSTAIRSDPFAQLGRSTAPWLFGHPGLFGRETGLHVLDVLAAAGRMYMMDNHLQLSLMICGPGGSERGEVAGASERILHKKFMTDDRGTASIWQIPQTFDEY
jgi:hypothetical protein